MENQTQGLPEYLTFRTSRSHFTHIQTWEALCKLTGRTDFLYVADCKLCTRANMDHIAHGNGRFITVLPGSRKEDASFRRYLQNHDLPWEGVIHRLRCPQRRNVSAGHQL